MGETIEGLTDGMNNYSIIITAYNCARWIGQCLRSALSQDHGSFSVVCIDAKSNDGTYEAMQPWLAEAERLGVPMTLERNEERKYQVENILRGVRLSPPGSICVSLDGDDWLASSHVLGRLDRAYSEDVYVTYGRYAHSDGSEIPRDAHHRYPDDVIAGNSYRKYHKQLYTHLRTWRRELFMRIDESDLKVDGKFAWNAGDCFFGYPLVEMAGERQAFIDEVLYIYNVSNPMSDHVVARDEQQRLADIAKSMQPYQRIERLT